MTSDRPSLPTIAVAAGEVICQVLDVPAGEAAPDFLELGGNSLQAVLVAQRLSRRLGQRIPPMLVLRYPRPDALAAAVAALEEPVRPGADVPVVPDAASAAAHCSPAGPGRYLAAHAQHRVWLLHELDPERLDHLIPVVADITGCLDERRFERAWDAAVERHDVLRTRFELAGGELWAVPDDETVPRLVAIDLSGLPPDVARRLLEERAEALHSEPMRLDSGPVARALLARMPGGRWRLHLSVHHIACDGWSLAILLGDLLTAYADDSALPAPQTRYADYARWERIAPRWPTDRPSLAETLGPLPDELRLPRRPSAVPARRDADEVAFHLDENLHESLALCTRSTGQSMLILCMAALAVLLARLTGQEDIIVAIPLAGRHEPEHEDVVGTFVNTSLARLDIRQASDLDAVLRRCHDAAETVLEFRAYPYDLLLAELGVGRSGIAQPLASVALAVQNFRQLPVPGTDLGFDWTYADRLERETKFDLTVSVVDEGASAQLLLTYRPSLFDFAQVAEWGRQYIEVLRRVAGMGDGHAAGS